MFSFGPFDSPASWMGFLAIAGTGVLGALYAMACQIRNLTGRHDLKVNVARLQIENTKRLREMMEAANAGAMQVQPHATQRK